VVVSRHRVNSLCGESTTPTYQEAPSGNGFNGCTLPGLLRLTGQAALSGGSAPAVKATARLKLLGLR
jgi:hypothetical protein